MTQLFNFRSGDRVTPSYHLSAFSLGSTAWFAVSGRPRLGARIGLNEKRALAREREPGGENQWSYTLHTKRTASQHTNRPDRASSRLRFSSVCWRPVDSHRRRSR